MGGWYLQWKSLELYAMYFTAPLTASEAEMVLAQTNGLAANHLCDLFNSNN